MMNSSKTNKECIETLKMVDVSPIATPAHLATITQMIVDQVSERMKTLAVTQTCGVKTEWASMAQLAQIFGVCRRTMERMMQEVLRKHDVQVIQATVRTLSDLALSSFGAVCMVCLNRKVLVRRQWVVPAGSL